MKKKVKTPSLPTITIKGDGNIIGDNNISIRQVSNPSKQDFLGLLNEIDKILIQTHDGDESDTKKKAISEVETVKELIKETKPEKQTILGKLKYLHELVTTGLGLSTLSTQLLPMIEKLTLWAKTLF